MEIDSIRLRDAVVADLPALLGLEAIFPSDRISERQLRRHLVSPRARLRVVERDAKVLGSALTFFRTGSTVARLYSLVVDPAARGLGLGQRLLQDAERGARMRGAARLRLEVRTDNRAAIGLYEAAGYRCIGQTPDYYEDGSDALRFERKLGREPQASPGDWQPAVREATAGQPLALRAHAASPVKASMGGQVHTRLRSP